MWINKCKTGAKAKVKIFGKRMLKNVPWKYNRGARIPQKKIATHLKKTSGIVSKYQLRQITTYRSWCFSFLVYLLNIIKVTVE